MARKIRVIAPHAHFPHYEAMAVAVYADQRKFLPMGEVVEIEMVHAAPTWLKELRAGCLLPADEATAKLAGVPAPAAPSGKKGSDR